LSISILQLDDSVRSAPNLLRRWYAIYTRSSHERRVAEHFASREIESFLPQYRVSHRWKNGCTKTLQLALFPGYIFARIAPIERVRVLEVPSVVSIVGTGREPSPVADSDLETLRAGIAMRKAEPHPYLVVGQRVRICCGALAGMEGVVVRKKNSLRVVLTLELIMKSIAVEVDGDELEALGAAPIVRCS
jgi:transcription antitermination factor NusG